MNHTGAVTKCSSMTDSSTPSTVPHKRMLKRVIEPATSGLQIQATVRGIQKP